MRCSPQRASAFASWSSTRRRVHMCATGAVHVCVCVFSSGGKRCSTLARPSNMPHMSRYYSGAAQLAMIAPAHVAAESLGSFLKKKKTRYQSLINEAFWQFVLYVGYIFHSEITTEKVSVNRTRLKGLSRLPMTSHTTLSFPSVVVVPRGP